MNIVTKLNNYIEKNAAYEIKKMRLQEQLPAMGIMQTHDWGLTKVYKITCECGDDGHSHNLWIEADADKVTVSINTQLKSKWWELGRWKTIYTLITKGFVEVEECVIMNEQQSYNYANTLLSAVNDVMGFKNAKRKKSV